MVYVKSRTIRIDILIYVVSNEWSERSKKFLQLFDWIAVEKGFDIFNSKSDCFISPKICVTAHVSTVGFLYKYIFYKEYTNILIYFGYGLYIKL